MTIQDHYMLTRLDRLQDLLIAQGRISEQILLGQAEILETMGKGGPSRLVKLLRYWPQIASSGAKHILTVVTVSTMIRGGSDATSVLDFISKQF